MGGEVFRSLEEQGAPPLQAAKTQSLLADELYVRDYEALVGDAAQAALDFGWRRVRKRLAPRIAVAADVACGTGRFLPNLCTIASRVYAVDRSRAMLQRAAARANGCATLLCQDMRALRLPEPAQLVTCRFASVNYLAGENDLARFFAAVAGSLARDGLFAFDAILHPQGAGAPFAARQDAVGPAGRSRWRHAVDPARGRTLTRIEWIGRQGEVLATQEHRQRWRTAAEVHGAFKSAGLKLVDIAAMPQGGPSNWFQLIAVPVAGRGA